MPVLRSSRSPCWPVAGASCGSSSPGAAACCARSLAARGQPQYIAMTSFTLQSSCSTDLSSREEHREHHVRPRQIRSQRLRSEQGVLPQGTRAARRRGRRGGRTDVRDRAQLGRQGVACACSRPRRSRRIFTWRSRPRIASRSTPSIARRWRRAARTTVRPACDRTTTRTTMRLSSSVRTGTTSKWSATGPAP